MVFQGFFLSLFEIQARIVNKVPCVMILTEHDDLFGDCEPHLLTISNIGLPWD